jgi:nucleotide-binding universal stress UspA family protein
MMRIVVGVDGSQESRRALEYAVAEARAHRGRVEAVHVWHVPYTTAYPYGALAVDLDEVESDARRRLDELVDGIDTRGLAQPVARTTTCGVPAQSLLDAAKGADLLVVGSRGLGGFRGLLLGSVSEQCVRHAGCPVVVVRPHQD